ncbi:hypothetical protein [Rhizobium yanglingense]
MFLIELLQIALEELFLFGLRLKFAGAQPFQIIVPDELAHDIDEGLLRFRVGVLAHVVEGGVDDHLDGLRTDLRLQLLDLLPEIFFGWCLIQAYFETGTALLKLVEHIVERSQTWASLGIAIADLLDDLALLAFDSFQFPGNTLTLVGSVPDRRGEVAAAAQDIKKIAMALTKGP